jgi:hypothetical protein
VADILQKLEWDNDPQHHYTMTSDDFVEAIMEIKRLRRIEKAAQNLVQQKGRYNTEQAYNALVGTLWA